MESIVATIDVVTCGEPMGLFASEVPGDLKHADRFMRVPAGAELNVATGLSRLGLTVGFLTRLGNDHLGHWLRDVMANERLDSRFIIEDAQHPTGLMFKSRRNDGCDPEIEYHRTGSAASHLGVDDYPSDYCHSAAHLHITGISPALSPSVRRLIFHMAKDMRQAGKTVSFDPNLRLRLWPSLEEMKSCLNELASFSDWIFPGLSEARLLTGLEKVDDIVDFYLAKGCSIVVIKLGAEGAYFGSANERGLRIGYPVSNIVDTVGAGDGFAAGVISALIEGLPLDQAVDRGNLIGARVLGFPGDSDGLPTRTQLSQFSIRAQQSQRAKQEPLK
ncbi:sugar kinase [Pseudomonas asplenii]|uniref:sugar kinase n=1 Tax=Pseudomonas asplenii TaxID=53407 RepID=UPI0037C6DF83